MKLIGIAGGSGTGKTSIADHIRLISPKKITVISQDSYYKDNSHLSHEERQKLNFDHPLAFDFDLLFEHLCLLKDGVTIKKPTYSYIERTRQKETVKVVPSEIIFIEGILLFYEERIVKLLDYKFFVDLNEQQRLGNIMNRDVKERGRDRSEILKRFYGEVNPMHKKFVDGQKSKADFIINNEAELEVTSKIIYDHLKLKNLC